MYLSGDCEISDSDCEISTDYFSQEISKYYDYYLDMLSKDDFNDWISYKIKTQNKN